MLLATQHSHMNLGEKCFVAMCILYIIYIKHFILFFSSSHFILPNFIHNIFSYSFLLNYASTFIFENCVYFTSDAVCYAFFSIFFLCFVCSVYWVGFSLVGILCTRFWVLTTFSDEKIYNKTPTKMKTSNNKKNLYEVNVVDVLHKGSLHCYGFLFSIQNV